MSEAKNNAPNILNDHVKNNGIAMEIAMGIAMGIATPKPASKIRSLNW